MKYEPIKESDMRQKAYLYIILLTLLFVSACGGGGDSVTEIPPTEMTITPEGVDDITQPLAPGTVIRFVVHFVPSNATETGVGWVSSNPDVATVDENGQLVLLNNGTTIITAVALGNPKLTWSISVTVKDGSIVINPDTQYGQDEAE